MVYPNSTTSQQIQAFVNFNNNIAKDEFGSLISIWQYTSETDAVVVFNAYEYTKPVANAPPFAELQRIPGKIADTLRISNLTDLTEELLQPSGFRSVPVFVCVFFISLVLMRTFRTGFYTATFANDARVIKKAIEGLTQWVEVAKGKAVGTYQIQVAFQPFPTVFSKHSLERGGNVLGLDRAKENLIRE